MAKEKKQNKQEEQNQQESSSPVQYDANYFVAGMDMDSSPQNVKEGFVTFALNATVENFDGKSFSYQNEQGNKIYITFPDGYKLIGYKVIYELNKIFYFLANDQNVGEIGYSYVNDSTYYTIINAQCLNFSIDYPIKSVAYQYVANTLRLYWTDNYNPRRFIDFSELPYERVGSTGCTTIFTGQIDCNRMNVQPEFSIPIIQIDGVVEGGNLQEGTYQFLIQYCDAEGNGYTSYYGITNPVSIFNDNVISFDTNLKTNKSIKLTCSNLDQSFYSYFKLAVVKTVNNIPKVILGDIYSTDKSPLTILYTGEGEDQKEQIPFEDIFVQYNIYSKAKKVLSSNGFLIWYGLTEKERICYQQIASKININWATYRLPYSKAYKKGESSALYKGYMRDEVYAFEIVFILKDGKQTDGFHIPGRQATPDELEIIDNPICASISSNLNSNSSSGFVDPNCDTIECKLPKWKLKDTSKIIDTLFQPTDDPCAEGIYQIGQMQYWESTETYPCNESIWGDLAGKPIRHHKFPSARRCPIHDEHGNIYIMGVYIDPNQIWKLIQESDLTDEQKADIAGFKILRGNRAVHKSIVAKGVLFNVGVFSDNSSNNANNKYYFPNYPLNDLSPDPFITKYQSGDNSGDNADSWLSAFSTRESYTNYTFHSPDVHFYQPAISADLSLRIESIEYGNVIGHTVSVKDHPGLKYLTRGSIVALVVLIVQLRQVKDDSAVEALVALKSLLDVLEETIPYVNYAKQFNCVGFYTHTHPVPDIPISSLVDANFNFLLQGNDLSELTFQIQEAKYLTSGTTYVNSGVLFNNVLRESSVYLRIDRPLPPPSALPIVTETSQFQYYQQYFSSINSGGISSVFTSQNPVFSDIGNSMIIAPPQYTFNISSSSIFFDNSRSMFKQRCDGGNIIGSSAIYYATIKNNLPSQYGQIYSYETVDTGYYYDFNTSLTSSVSTNIVFGGDIFINRFALKRKHSFFTQNLVNKPQGLELDYRLYNNVGYPNYWISNDSSGLSDGDISGLAATIGISAGIDIVSGAIGGALSGGLIGGPIGAGVGLIGGLLSGLFSGAKQAAKDSAIAGLLYGIGKFTHIKSLNLNCIPSGVKFYHKGEFYLFAYGIPYFYCESEVNVDMRRAFNEKEGDFYPHVGEGIPDEWLQEINVPISYDNTYYYNQTYSKQNKESFVSHFPEDANSGDSTSFDYRAIYSLPASDRIDYKFNNWLIYPPLNYYDFEQNKGRLVSIDEINDNTLLVRFENGSQLFNSAPRVDTVSGSFYLTSFDLFRATPRVNLMDSDTGYAGSQHSLFISAGTARIFVDAKRGDIFMIPFNKYYYTRIFPVLITRGISKFLKEYLPFRISNYFPDVDIDNPYKGIGLAGVYDSFYNRVIITKLDYEPKIQGIVYQNGKFYYDGQEIQLTDTNYFYNRSFTISFSLTTNSWVSFHSYLPNYYIPYSNFFFSGVNDSPSTLWIHNIEKTLFNNFYGNIHPYIIEYPYSYKGIEDKVVQSIMDYSQVYQYDGDSEIVVDDVYFNKVILYNDRQCSGLLELEPRKQGDLSAYGKYPIFKNTSKIINFVKSGNFYKYNMFWDVVKDSKSPIFIFNDANLYEFKVLNQDNMDYSNRAFSKYPLRSKYLKVRNILDNTSNYKIVSVFTIGRDQISIK